MLLYGGGLLRVKKPLILGPSPSEAPGEKLLKISGPFIFAPRCYCAHKIADGMISRMDEQEKRTAHRELRLALYGSVVGLLIVYPVLITVKLAGYLPLHFTWPKVLAGPMLFYGLILLPFWISKCADRRIR